MKKAVKIIIGILVLVAIVVGIVSCVISNRFEYNDENALGNTAGNLYNDGLFCEVDGYIYYANPNDGGKLYRMDADGKNNKEIYNDTVAGINVCGDYVYYIRDNHEIGQESVFKGNMFGVFRVGINGGSPEELYSDYVDSLALTGNKLYFRSYSEEDLIRVKSVGIDGENFEEISKSDYWPVSIYNKNMYYANVEYNHNIVKMDVSDNSTSTVKEGNFYMPIVEEGVMYYIDVDAGYKLMKQDLSSGEEEVLSEDRCVNYNVSTKYGVIYYQCENDEDDHRLMMMDLNGDNAEVVEYGDCSSINITKKYTYYYKIAGIEKTMYYVETGKTPTPKEF